MDQDFDYTWTYADINGNECESTLGSIKTVEFTTTKTNILKLRLHIQSPLLPSRLRETFAAHDKEFRDSVEGITFKSTSPLGGHSYKFLHSAVTRKYIIFPTWSTLTKNISVSNNFEAFKNEQITIKTLEVTSNDHILIIDTLWILLGYNGSKLNCP